MAGINFFKGFELIDRISGYKPLRILLIVLGCLIFGLSLIIYKGYGYHQGAMAAKDVVIGNLNRENDTLYTRYNNLGLYYHKELQAQKDTCYAREVQLYKEQIRQVRAELQTSRRIFSENEKTRKEVTK